MIVDDVLRFARTKRTSPVPSTTRVTSARTRRTQGWSPSTTWIDECLSLELKICRKILHITPRLNTHTHTRDDAMTLRRSKKKKKKKKAVQSAPFLLLFFFFLLARAESEHEEDDDADEYDADASGRALVCHKSTSCSHHKRKSYETSRFPRTFGRRTDTSFTRPKTFR